MSRGAPTRITWFRSVRWCLAVGFSCGDQRRLTGNGSALEVVLHDYALYKSTFTTYFTCSLCGSALKFDPSKWPGAFSWSMFNSWPVQNNGSKTWTSELLDTSVLLWCEGGSQSSRVPLLHDFLESSVSVQQHAVPASMFKQFWVMDIVTPNSTQSCCFTKRFYTRLCCFLIPFVLSRFAIVKRLTLR